MSIQSDVLMESAELWAFTLTVRDTPPDARTFHALRRAWLRRVERALGDPQQLPSPGTSADTDIPRLPLWSWVMEWQQRGTPHLHGIIVAPRGMRAQVLELVFRAWPEVASAWGTGPQGQDVRPVFGAAGWFGYLSKHIGRGKHHAQRSSLPPGWEASGRLWGHSEGWPTSEAAFSVDVPAFVQLRRLMHSWAMADARSERLPEVRARRVAYLKKRRQVRREVSPFVGMVEWIPPEVTGRLLEWIVAQGSVVVEVETGLVLELNEEGSSDARGASAG